MAKISYTTKTDDVLLMQVRKDDQQAFKALYDRYWTPLWSYARNAMEDPDDAEDIVQELFVSIWEKRADLQIHTSLRAYLYRAVLNKVIDRIDRSKHRDTYLENLKHTYDAQAYTTDSLLLTKELTERVETCVDKMPPKMRTIFSLSRFEHMSHQQISEYLGISRENVNRQIKNALILLKKNLLLLAIILKYFLP